MLAPPINLGRFAGDGGAPNAACTLARGAKPPDELGTVTQDRF